MMDFPLTDEEKVQIRIRLQELEIEHPEQVDHHGRLLVDRFAGPVAVLVGDGGVGSGTDLPSFAFVNSPTSGFWRDNASSEVRLSISGGQRVRFGNNNTLFQTDVLPASNLTYSLGSTSFKWNVIYGGTALLANGSAGNPAYSFDSDSSAGFWRDSGTSEVRLSIGGGAKYRFGNNTAVFGTDFIPSIDNTFNNGTGTFRWQLVRGVTITSGDLRFENDVVLTEHYNIGDGVPRGIALIDDRDRATPRLAAFISADGTMYARAFKNLDELPGKVSVSDLTTRTGRSLDELAKLNGREE